MLFSLHSPLKYRTFELNNDSHTNTLICLKLAAAAAARRSATKKENGKYTRKSEWKIYDLAGGLTRFCLFHILLRFFLLISATFEANEEPSIIIIFITMMMFNRLFWLVKNHYKLMYFCLQKGGTHSSIISHQCKHYESYKTTATTK